MNPSKIHFANSEEKNFSKELKLRVDTFFKDKGISTYANTKMVFKTIILLGAFAGSYFLLLFGGFNPVINLLLCMMLGLSIAGIGFSVQHDANHGAYSSKSWVNNLLGFTLNLIGGNAFTWKVQHNVLHHTFTNIHDYDEDLDAGIIVRLSKERPRKKFHRFQHYFAFLAYGLLTLSWVFIKDFKKISRYNGSSAKTGSIVTWKEFIILFLSKAFYCFYMIYLPITILNLSTGQFLAGFLTMHFTSGVVLSSVFQMAHVVEGPEQIVPPHHGLVEHAWHIHQLRTTSNFAVNNRFLTWFVGGLNYQVEHHLFPRICSIHYPEISKIVKSTALEFGYPYYEYPTFGSALKSHYKHLKLMGTQD